MNERRRPITIGILLLCFMGGCLLLSACTGSVATSEEESPNLIGAAITSYNEGSESEQYVNVELTFDRPIRVSEKSDDSLRITIAKERVAKDEYTLTRGEDETKAELLIPVEAVTTGVLEIEKSEKADVISDITDETGQYGANDFTLEGMIPSGVTLSTLTGGRTAVTKLVDTSWDIRSIAWVAITKDGEVIPAKGTDSAEELDGYVALHGHEFLSENPKIIAGRLAELLEASYDPNEYAFESSGNSVTLTVLNEVEGEYDIRIYNYLKINGEEVPVVASDESGLSETVSGEETEAADAEALDASGGEASEEDEEHDVKTKEPVIDREPTAQEQAFLDRLHLANLPDEEFPDGGELYTTITITGRAMPEEEIYSVSDLEQLLELSFENEAMNEIALPCQVTEDGETYYGMDLVRFLSLCGVDTDADSLYMKVESGDGSAQTVDVRALLDADAPVALVTADDAAPLPADGTGPIACICGDTIYGDVSRIILDDTEDPVDPEYHYHNREPWSEDLDLTFSIEVYQDGAEYRGALTTKTYTMEELEQLMRDEPEHVISNYYGTIGNRESFSYTGTGNWLDYFDGIDLKWLLTEEVGIDELSGRAELYNRDLELSSTIDDLDAYFHVEDTADYYTITSDGICIPNAIPIISCSKNGYPILRGHIHEGDGYISYNHMNDQLEERGISTEIGVVKNHNGPFVACLGDLDGVYGGNQAQTDADCILMKIYLD